MDILKVLMILFFEKQYKLKSDSFIKLNYIRICIGMYVGILFIENGKMVKENYYNEERRLFLFKYNC